MSHYIYCHGPQNLNSGGVIGYLSRLYQAFQTHRPNMKTNLGTDICFKFSPSNIQSRYFSMLPCSTDVDIYISLYNQLSKELKSIDDTLHPSFKIKKYSRCFRELPKISIINSDDSSKSIHINGSYNFFPIWNELQYHNQVNSTIKILSTHNPCVPFAEELSVRETADEWSSNELEAYGKYMELRDTLAFAMSDVILCPTEYSLEGYKSWACWDELIHDKPVYYCLTGTDVEVASKSKEDLRAELGIPSNSLIVLYIGRKEKIRGFDIFVEAAKTILKMNLPNIYFIAVGSGHLKANINDHRFIDIGHSSTVNNFINAADVCVTTNRGSYFDLSMIEFLAFGCILVASKVGGYKWLENKTNGVVFFQDGNHDQLVKSILQISKLDRITINSMKLNNSQIYKKYLTSYCFQNNYQNTIDTIRKDFKNQFLKPNSSELTPKPQIIGKYPDSFRLFLAVIYENLRQVIH